VSPKLAGTRVANRRWPNFWKGLPANEHTIPHKQLSQKESASARLNRLIPQESFLLLESQNGSVKAYGFPFEHSVGGLCGLVLTGTFALVLTFSPYQRKRPHDSHDRAAEREARGIGYIIAQERRAASF